MSSGRISALDIPNSLHNGEGETDGNGRSMIMESVQRMHRQIGNAHCLKGGGSGGR